LIHFYKRYRRVKCFDVMLDDKNDMTYLKIYDKI